MQEKKLTRAKIVIDALRNHYGEKVGEFAERLGVGASTVSTWANRDRLDEDLIFRKCKGVNYEFLKTGEGEMFVYPEQLEDENIKGADLHEEYQPQFSSAVLKSAMDLFQELVKRMPEGDAIKFMIEEASRAEKFTLKNTSPADSQTKKSKLESSKQ